MDNAMQNGSNLKNEMANEILGNHFFSKNDFFTENSQK